MIRLRGRAEGRSAAWTALLISSILASSSEGLEKPLHIERRVGLIEISRWVQDVRWQTDDRVFLAGFDKGVVEVSLTGEVASAPRVLIPSKESDPSGIWLGARLGVSAHHVVVGAVAFEIVWLSLEAEELKKRYLFEAIQDLDVFEDRLAVLGTQRGENGFIGTDGAIAWTISLRGELADPRPILYSVSGPSARLMDNCSGHEFGALRFLSDGSLVIAPGAEPGVYLYDPVGVLAYTWPTEPLGIDPSVCDFDLNESARLGEDFVELSKRLSRFTVIDDLVPLGDEPGLLLRYVVDGEVRWRLAVLHRDSPATMLELPVTSPSIESHLRGDVRGERLVLLRTQGGDKDQPPDAEPLLVTLGLSR